MTFHWKDEHTEKFLQLYGQYECLWNKKCEQYKKRKLRNSAYRAMRNKLNFPSLTVGDIKAKIKTVRTRYCSELAKVRASEQSGAPSNEWYVPRLYWFKAADSFLRNVCMPKAIHHHDAQCSPSSSVKNVLKQHIKKKPDKFEPYQFNKSPAHTDDCSFQDAAKENLKEQFDELLEETESLEENETTEIKSEKSYETYTDEMQCEPFLHDIPEQATSQFLNNESNKISAKRPRSLNSVSESVQKFSKISDEYTTQRPVHEFDAFCHSLAIQLKNMPVREALICQEKLQAVMTNQRLSLLSYNADHLD